MSFLTGVLLGVGGGMVIGWIFLPEPKWVRDIFVKWGWAKPTVVS